MATKKTETTSKGRKTKPTATAVTDGTVAPKRTRRSPATSLSIEERNRRIAMAAYLRAEQRGFSPGNELDDWIVAEREVDAQLQGARA